MATLPDRFTPTDSSPPTTWTDFLLPQIGQTTRWRVYTDGSWYASSPAQADVHFQAEGACEGRGAILLVPDTPSWETDTIISLPFHFPRRDPLLGGSAYLMELLACTASSPRASWNTCGLVVLARPNPDYRFVPA